MKYLIILLLSVFAYLFWPGVTTAQSTQRRTVPPVGSLHAGTIDSQFIYLNRISRSQEGFKLIRPANLDIVRKNIADSLQSQRAQIIEAESQLVQARSRVSNLQDSLEVAQQEIEELEQRIESISFFGAQLKKSTYHLLVWSLIIALLVILLISMFRFQRGNAIAREARETLGELQEEFDQHRKKSLEKEQKLKRQLQDEINKRNG